MLNNFIKQFNSLVSPSLAILDINSKAYSPILSAVVSIFLIGYASLAAPKLPRDVAEVLAGNPFVKVLFMAAIVWLFSNRRNPALAILIAVCFLITTMVLDKHRLSDIATAVQLENDEPVVVKPSQVESVEESQPEPIQYYGEPEPEPEVEQSIVQEDIPELPVVDEDTNEHFVDDAPKCNDYQEKANDEYKKYTHNGCNLVSQGCGIKTSENQCGAQGVDCQPNWIQKVMVHIKKVK